MEQDKSGWRYNGVTIAISLASGQVITHLKELRTTTVIIRLATETDIPI